jgi:hypothetical protein
MTAVMTITAPSISPALAPADGPPVAVVEISDDDIPLPGWDQWVRQPISALDGGTRDEGGRLRDVGVSGTRR